MSRLRKDADGLVLPRVSCLSGKGVALLGGSAEAVRGITSRDWQNHSGEPFHAVTVDQAWFLRHGPGNIAWHDRVPDGITVRSEARGRFNPEGFPVLYLCLTPECSAMEFLSHPPHIFPRHLYRYGINIENVLDPTGSEGRSLVRTSETVIRGPRGSDTQSVGMRAHGLGYNAIRSFSATGEGETLTVFPDRVVLDVDVIAHETFDVWPQFGGC